MYVCMYLCIRTMYGCNCVLSLCAENAHSQKLMNEYEKYQELQARNQKLQEDYEWQLAEIEASREKALAELTAFSVWSESKYTYVHVLLSNHTHVYTPTPTHTHTNKSTVTHTSYTHCSVCT